MTPLKGTPRLTESWGFSRNGILPHWQFQWVEHVMTIIFYLGLPKSTRQMDIFMIIFMDIFLDIHDQMQLSSSRAAKHLRQCMISSFFKTSSRGFSTTRQDLARMNQRQTPRSPSDSKASAMSIGLISLFFVTRWCPPSYTCYGL